MNANGQAANSQTMAAMSNQVPQLAQMVNGAQQANGMTGNGTPRMNALPVTGGVPGQLMTRPIVVGQMPQMRRVGSNGQMAQMGTSATSASPVNALPVGVPNGMTNGLANGVPTSLANGLPNGMNNTPLNLVNMAAAARQGQISPQVLQALLQNGNRLPNGTKFPSPMDNNGNGWLKMSS